MNNLAYPDTEPSRPQWWEPFVEVLIDGKRYLAFDNPHNHAK